MSISRPTLNIGMGYPSILVGLVSVCHFDTNEQTYSRPRLRESTYHLDQSTLRIATLSLVYSISEYCAPVRCRSAHTRLIDSVLNDALRIVTGCLRFIPTDHLPVLSGIQPAELRRMGATLSLAHRGSLDPDHILYGLLSGSSDTHQVRLRSRRPFVSASRNLFDNLAGLEIRAFEWTNHKICDLPSVIKFHEKWKRVKLNRLRTGVGRFHFSMHKWGLFLHRIPSVAPLSKPQTMF